MKTGLSYCFILLALLASNGIFAQKSKKANLDTKGWQQGIYANIVTDKGAILIKLEHEKVPLTVANFVGLAEGNFKPFDSIQIEKPFYAGLKFHRVIANFMIQGGDPTGTGMGDPGYKFFDEFHPDLMHDGPGVLSMANSGPNTNGSQFFVTHKETAWLNNKHSVFGKVVKGQDVVNAIAQDDVMRSVQIIRVGKAVKKYNATQVFRREYEKAQIKAAKLKAEAEEKAAKAKVESEEKAAKLKVEHDRIKAMSIEEYNALFFKEMSAKYPDAKQTATGLMYVINNSGSEKPVKGNKVKVHYTGTLTDGSKFDSSKDRNQPFDFDLGMGRVIRGWDEGIPLIGKGGSATLIIPYHLAYGERGSGKIPAFSTLIFEVDLLDFEKNEEGKIAEMSEAEYRKYFLESTLKKYPNAQQTASGLMYVMHNPGGADKPKPGQNVSVHYTGTLTNGTKFDSSRDRNEPIDFAIGVGQVIRGWDEGIPLLGKGGKATLIIPHYLAYGPGGMGPIPPYATLLFDVELMDFK